MAEVETPSQPDPLTSAKWVLSETLATLERVRGDMRAMDTHIDEAKRSLVAAEALRQGWVESNPDRESQARQWFTESCESAVRVGRQAYTRIEWARSNVEQALEVIDSELPTRDVPVSLQMTRFRRELDALHVDLREASPLLRKVTDRLEQEVALARQELDAAPDQGWSRAVGAMTTTETTNRYLGTELSRAYALAAQASSNVDSIGEAARQRMQAHRDRHSPGSSSPPPPPVTR